MATLGNWITGARVRTLPLAAAPIILGSATADLVDKFDLLLGLGALAVALLLQIGVNYANDYSDGVRGTDDNRVGPTRLTASGLARPTAVRRAAFITFGLAGVIGLVMVFSIGQWWLLALGAMAITAAWYYTGGKTPYGYTGLGEASVFVFFGLVATMGTNYLMTESFDLLAVILGAASGCYAAAVLLVNNIRDRESDLVAGKHTLAGKLGDKRSRALFLFLIYLPIALNIMLILVYPATVLGLLNLLLIVPITGIALSGRTAKELILALKLGSLAGFFYGLLVGLGLFIVSFNF
jgi:1,4-dihydroxy-2-naphthoate polyprenyltransferase